MAGVHPQYSTLEVNPSHTSPEVYVEAQKELVANQVAAGYEGTGYQGVGGYQDVTAYQGPATYPPQATYAGATEYQNTTPYDGYPTETPRPFYKKTRWIVTVVVIAALIVMGVVLGSVLGTQLHTTSSNTTEKPAQGDPNRKILSGSRLTASNYTDSDGVAHRTVFFQDGLGNLVARMWDSRSTSWTTRNISDELGSVMTLKLASGSSLASSSTDDWVGVHEIHVWYFDASYRVQSIYWDRTNDMVALHPDWFANKLTATPGSSIAASWQRPVVNDTTTSGYWRVIYQAVNGDLKDASAANLRSPNTIASGSDVSGNSSFALVPELQGYFLSTMTAMWQSKSGGASLNSWTGTGGWDSTKAFSISDSLPGQAPTLQFASTAWDHFTKRMFLVLAPGGGLSANWWDGTGYRSIASTKLSSGPSTNFTAIAMTTDAMFYGISGDQILEYSVDQTDPSTFHYTGVVFG
ncbi:hypothetical protein GQ53DRAFT_838019 [Thozetella sp. PMI_491]|nr:hypothetical protein GQ53DRAFT_838019 [Thozetella sp. PMI_491]